MFKKVGLFIMAMAVSVGLAGCGASKAPIGIEIEMEDGGIITAELYPDKAPKSVENFVNLINENYFDGLIFHRVSPEFMIQGGGMYADGTTPEKKVTPIKGEFKENGVTNDLSHTRGVLSMARTNDMNSATSQFFIMEQDSTFLDGKYAAFGKVTGGMDVVDRIGNAEKVAGSDGTGKPIVDQVIKTMRIINN